MCNGFHIETLAPEPCGCNRCGCDRCGKLFATVKLEPVGSSPRCGEERFHSEQIESNDWGGRFDGE
jgi:predicted  nucleic acid-binding Zn-ribbon protein